MQKIPGIECSMVGSSPARQGSCSESLSGTANCTEIRSQMQNISIQIDDILYTVPPISYAPESAFDPGRCTPNIEFQESSPVNLLGYPFFENFVTTFNYTHGSMGFGLNINAPAGAGVRDITKPKPSPGPLPPAPPSPDDPSKHHTTPPMWLVITLVVTAIVVVLILIILIVCCCQKMKRDEKAREIAYASIEH